MNPPTGAPPHTGSGRYRGRPLRPQGALAEAVSARDEAQAALYASRRRGARTGRRSGPRPLRWTRLGEAEAAAGEVAALRAQLERERSAAAGGGGGAGEDPLAALRAQVALHSRAAEAAELEAVRLQRSSRRCRRRAAAGPSSSTRQRATQERAAAEADARAAALRGARSGD